MVNKSPNTNKTNNHLKPLNTETSHIVEPRGAGDLIFIIIALGEVILLLYLNILFHLNIINCFV
jgi:hypothetical protein